VTKEPADMLLYPTVDIAGGRCVRLDQGRPERETVYYEDPLDAALRWQGEGAEAIHVVDLDAALGEGRPNAGVVARILDGATVPVHVAGGLRDEQAVRAALAAGAARVVVGTRAVREPEWAAGLCCEHRGRVVIALDARQGRVAVEGWRRVVGVGPAELARRLAEAGPAAFLYTDVARDGMLSRPNFAGVEQLLDAVRVPIIAAGGVASLEDLRRLGECGADAVVVGKALYEGVFSLAEALEVCSAYPSRLPARPAEAPGGVG